MFKQEMADKIFKLQKTQTRRLMTNKRVYKEDSVQPIQVSYRKPAIGHIRILKTYPQKLGAMTKIDVEAEGFETWNDYIAYLEKINKQKFTDDFVVRVYEFCLIQAYLYKMPKSNFNDSDAYGFKKMLSEIIKNYTCPECQKQKGKLGFFVWEDESKGLAICSTCSFKKEFINSPVTAEQSEHGEKT